MDADARCCAIAAKQYGVIHLNQAERAGLSKHAVGRRVQAGLWRRIHPGVFAITAVPDSFEQRAMAAALYAGKGSAVAFETAGYLWKLLEREPETIDLWTTRSLGAEGVVFHRIRALDRADVTRLGPIPITNPARTLIDLAAHVDDLHLEEALHAGLWRGRPSRPRLERRLEALGTRGRRQAGRLTQFLEICPDRPPQSGWETRMFRDLRTLGMPYPLPQYPFSYRREHFRHDFFYADESVAIECDSREGHLAPRDFERERRKLNALQHMPWKVVHVTHRWHRVDREGVLDRIARELGRTRRFRNQ